VAGADAAVGRRELVFVEVVGGEDQTGGIGGTLTKMEGVAAAVGTGRVEGRMSIVVVFGLMVCGSGAEERLWDREDEIVETVAVVEVGIERALVRLVVVNLRHRSKLQGSNHGGE
jgi:hypothetical protein